MDRSIKELEKMVTEMDIKTYEEFEKINNNVSRLEKIIDNDSLRKVVVVSAIGKEDKTDNKITDLLYLLSAHIRYGVDGSHLWKQIYNRYNKYQDKIIHTLVGLDSEEAAPPKPATFEF